MFITTKLVGLITGETREQWFQWYEGPVDLACGASKEQQDLGTQQTNVFKDFATHADSVFGSDSQIFGDLTSVLQPIFAAGPNQLGFSAPEKAALDSGVVTNEGIAARNAKAATGNALNAVGGGNTALPSGTDAGITASVNQKFAQDTATELNKNEIADYQQGRANWATAGSALSGAGNVFDSAAGVENAATNAGSAASKTQADITEANNSWEQIAGGALGGAVGGWASGGFKT